MKAHKLLLAATFLAFSPALHAAQTYVSHFETLQGMTVHKAAHQVDGADQLGSVSQPMVLSFEAHGQRFDLDLVVNDRVLAALPEGPAYESVSAYRGQLLGNAESWVRIVMYDGMPRGLVWDGETMFAIEAPGDSAVETSEPVIYRLADLNILPGTMTCGADSLSGNAQKMYASMSGGLEDAVAQAPGAVSEITMSIIGDSSFTADQGSDEAAAAAITTRLSNVDGYFSEQVGVQLNVQLIETFDAATDPFDDTLDSGDLLNQLSLYRDRTSAHNSQGLTHLFTGRDVWSGSASNTSAVGVAWLGGLCDQLVGAGLSEGRAGAVTDSLIVAHEIGHNFGAEHDGAVGSSCELEAETFIMAPSVNGNDQFSACSITIMQAEAAGASCVSALPAIDVGIERNDQLSTVLLGANTVINYEVSVNGTLGVTDVVADFTLSPVFALDSIATSTGNCDSGAGTASCSFGNLTGLSSHTVTITGTPVAVGTGTLSASVSTPDADERAANNQDSLQLTVDPAVDLVVGTPATSPAFVDTSTTVSATLDNLSTLQASNVSLSITLDAGLRAESADWSIGSCTVSAQQIDCQAGSFDPQSSSSLSITATTLSLGMQDVSVSITSDEDEANPSDNTASRAVNVVSPQGEEEDSGGGSPSPLLLLLLALFARRRCYYKSRSYSHLLDSLYNKKPETGHEQESCIPPAVPLHGPARAGNCGTC
jgi:hypothetical protein